MSNFLVRWIRRAVGVPGPSTPYQEVYQDFVELERREQQIYQLIEYCLKEAEKLSETLQYVQEEKPQGRKIRAAGTEMDPSARLHNIITHLTEILNHTIETFALIRAGERVSKEGQKVLKRVISRFQDMELRLLSNPSINEEDKKLIKINFERHMRYLEQYV